MRRADAVRLARAVQIAPSDDGGDHLLTGEVEIEIEIEGGAGARAALSLPPGAPERPVTGDQLRAKLERCAGPEADRLAELSFESAAAWLRSRLAA